MASGSKNPSTRAGAFGSSAKRTYHQSPSQESLRTLRAKSKQFSLVGLRGSVSPCSSGAFIQLFQFDTEHVRGASTLVVSLLRNTAPAQPTSSSRFNPRVNPLCVEWSKEITARTADNGIPSEYK